MCSGGKPAVGIDVYSCQICIHYMGVMDTLERNNTVKAEVEVRLCNPLKAFHSVFPLVLEVQRLFGDFKSLMCRFLDVKRRITKRKQKRKFHNVSISCSLS